MKYPNWFKALVLSAFVTFLPSLASAQTVIQVPQYVDQSVGKDFGNGPIELKIVQGNAVFVTSQGFGTVSSANGTLITLQATPANLPCVNSLIATNTTYNCVISGPGITPGTLIGSYTPGGGTGPNGSGPIIGVANLNTALLAQGTQLGWGAACPATQPSSGLMPAQAAQPPGDFPFYTYARVCAYSQFSPGAMVLPFAIGAH